MAPSLWGTSRNTGRLTSSAQYYQLGGIPLIVNTGRLSNWNISYTSYHTRQHRQNGEWQKINTRRRWFIVMTPSSGGMATEQEGVGVGGSLRESRRERRHISHYRALVTSRYQGMATTPPRRHGWRYAGYCLRQCTGQGVTPTRATTMTRCWLRYHGECHHCQAAIASQRRRAPYAIIGSQPRMEVVVRMIMHWQVGCRQVSIVTFVSVYGCRLRHAITADTMAALVTTGMKMVKSGRHIDTLLVTIRLHAGEWLTYCLRLR